MEKRAKAGLVKGLILGAVLVCSLGPDASYAQQERNWFQRLFIKPTWEQLVSECNSPETICALVDRHLGYVSEPVDTWAGAENVWKKGWGDCDDFAVCVEQLCHEHGFDASVYLYYPTKPLSEGHAVVVGHVNGRLWMSSNGGYEEFDSMDEIRESVSRVIGCGKDEMWFVTLNHEAIQRYVSESAQSSVAAP